MPTPTTNASSGLSKDSRIVFTNHGSAFMRVASSNSTTVTVDNADLITGDALYTSTTPGLLVISEGTAAADNGKTANVTGVSGTAFTVDTDLSADLTDGTIVSVYPPHSIELKTNGGHGLQISSPPDFTKALTDTFDVHNTRDVVDIGGSIPTFLPQTTQGFARLLAWGVGAYKKSSTGVHDMVPVESNDGTFANAERATVYSKEGNALIEQVYGNLFCTGFSINIGAGPTTAEFQATGNVYAREVGGTGKTFPSGTNDYVKTTLKADADSRYSSIGAFVEFGGTFGDAISDSRETAVDSVTVNYTKEVISNRPLGSPYNVNDEEAGVMLEFNMTKKLGDQNQLDDFMGGFSDPQGDYSETRTLITLVPSGVATTESIVIDAPRTIVTVHDVTRERGHFKVNFTVRALHTLTANEIPDTSVPLVRFRCDTSDDGDLLTTL